MRVMSGKPTSLYFDFGRVKKHHDKLGIINLAKASKSLEPLTPPHPEILNPQAPFHCTPWCRQILQTNLAMLLGEKTYTQHTGLTPWWFTFHIDLENKNPENGDSFTNQHHHLVRCMYSYNYNFRNHEKLDMVEIPSSKLTWHWKIHHF